MLFTIRKHWKKSLFGSLVLCYGFHYSSQRYREYLVRRAFFLQAKKYGEETIHPLEKPRRLYVILNPMANDGKCKKIFQKNAVPILHLAGIEITYIQTDYENHAKAIVNYFNPTFDGVVVAGGDGTVQEVLTGILRQKSNDPIANFPLGIIPIGVRTNVFKKLFGADVVRVREICEASLDIVKGHSKKVNVMEVKTEQRSIFALDSIHIGLNQDVKEKIDARRYWLLGPFKSYFAFLWRTVKNWPPDKCVTLSSPDLGTNRNVVPSLVDRREGFAENVENHQNGFKTSSLSLYLQEDNNKNPQLNIQVMKEDQTRQKFARFGWEWLKNNFTHTTSEISETLLCTELSIFPPENEVINFGIDGEMFDAKPVKVIVHPQKISMFCSPPSES